MSFWVIQNADPASSDGCTQFGRVCFAPLTADPTDLYEGDLWYRSDLKQLRQYVGGVTVPVAGSGVEIRGGGSTTFLALTGAGGVVFAEISTDAGFSPTFLLANPASLASIVLNPDGSSYFGYSGAKVGIRTAAPTAPLHVVGLVTYASQAAAVGAGLTSGAFYTDGGGNPHHVI
jgi:hypothetical protein